MSFAGEDDQTATAMLPPGGYWCGIHDSTAIPTRGQHCIPNLTTISSRGHYHSARRTLRGLAPTQYFPRLEYVITMHVALVWPVSTSILNKIEQMLTSECSWAKGAKKRKGFYRPLPSMALRPPRGVCEAHLHLAVKPYVIATIPSQICRIILWWPLKVALACR